MLLPLDAPVFDVPDEFELPKPLLELLPKPLFELPPNALLELPPNPLFELPPNPDDCPNPDPPPGPPNAEPLEPFICPTVFAPAMGVLPTLPPIDSPGSP